MSRACDISAILPDKTISVTETQLSYVKCLMPGSKLTKMFILYRDQHPYQSLQREQSPLADLESSVAELDITGSPLKSALSYPTLDQTFIDNKNWKIEEESHLPLSILEARVAVNVCLKHISEKAWSLPLLAVCNGKDNDRTVLNGTHLDGPWFITMQGLLSDARRLSNIEETPAILLKEYTNMYSVPEHKVCTTVSSTYDLCGKRPGVVDLLNVSPDCWAGNLSLEVNWNTLSFYAPIRTSTTTLVMEIIVGWNESHLKNLWNELLLLHKYLNMLEQCKSKKQHSHTFDSSDSNPITWEQIAGKLNLLLIQENENIKDDDHNGDVIDDIKLEQHIDNVRFRQNMDFADMLWELLIGCADYAQVTASIRMVLEKTQSGLATPKISPTNKSRINKIVSEILCQKGVVSMLDEDLPLELLIDTGLEKLSRDYYYILLSGSLIDFHDLRQILCNVQGELFDIESCRKKLTLLAQIHLCLEFTLFAQNYLHLPFATLQSIFNYAFRQHVSKNSAIKLFSDLHGNKIQCLNVPLPTVAVKHIVQELPSSWCVTFSSEDTLSKITTTSHLSRTPILPPNIYCCDESNEEEVYHCLKLNTSYMKIA